MKYQISKKAYEDIENIWLYTFENWSQEQADRYFQLIFDEIEYLSENPYLGMDFSNIRIGYRRSKVKSHYIFYRIITDKIEIIRILHQRMNVEFHLEDKF